MKQHILTAMLLSLLFAFTACGPGAPATPDPAGTETQAQPATLTEEQMKAMYFEWTRISIELSTDTSSEGDIHQKADEALRAFRAKHQLSQQQFLELMQMGQEKNWALDYINQ